MNAATLSADSLGSILLKLNKITRQQLNEALERRSTLDEYVLSAILRDMGAVDEDDVALALRVQADLRRGRPWAAALGAAEAQLDRCAAEATALATRLAERPVTLTRRHRRTDGPRAPVPTPLRLQRA